MTLTISTELIAEAKALRINTSSAAEAGIASAVKAAKEKAWLTESRGAIDAYNKRVDASGPLLTSKRPKH